MASWAAINPAGGSSRLSNGPSNKVFSSSPCQAVPRPSRYPSKYEDDDSSYDTSDDDVRWFEKKTKKEEEEDANGSAVAAQGSH
ncbi:hypothetical protein ACHAWF_008625 [Thalassiosira exigua]